VRHSNTAPANPDTGTHLHIRETGRNPRRPGARDL